MPSGEARLLVQQLVSQQALSLKDEYGHLEKDMAIHIYDHPERSPTAMTLDSQTQLLTLLSTLPHGVIKWSHAVPGMSSSVWLLSETVVLFYNPKHKMHEDKRKESCNNKSIFLWILSRDRTYFQIHNKCVSTAWDLSANMRLVFPVMSCFTYDNML